MLSRALLVLLAVMNLGVALWWMTRAAPAAPAPAREAAGVPVLRLLSEGVVDAPREPARRCYRFGPYGDPADVDAARQAAAGLPGAAGDPAVVTVPGPPPAQWRVVAPPPPDGDTAALATRIEAAGFDDFMVVAEGPEAGSIALGRFSTPEAAQRRRQALLDAGFAAQLHPVGGNSDWLRVAVADDGDVQRVRAALGALQVEPDACDD